MARRSNKSDGQKARHGAVRGESGVLWRGYLKLSLVSCAVAVVPAATEAERLTVHTLNAATGHRVRRRYVDAVTGKPVAPDQQVKGYEVGKDTYIQVTDAELETLRPESSHTIDIRQFTEPDRIDPVWHRAGYFLVPDDSVGLEAYGVIRDAMRETGLVGVGRVTIQSRERRCTVAPRGKGMLLMTLRYPYEVRDAADAFAGIDPHPDLSDEARTLVARLVEEHTGRFRPADLRDRHKAALLKLARSKDKGTEPPPPPKPPQPAAGTVVNLMDALKASIRAEKRR